MTDIQNTIEQYRESCAAIHSRITEMNARISGQAPLLVHESVLSLQKRRYLLYMELAEMEQSIRQMSDYLAPPEQPDAVSGF